MFPSCRENWKSIPALNLRSLLSPLARHVEATCASRGLRKVPDDDDAAFDFVHDYRWRHASIRMWQIKSEFLAFVAHVRELEPRSVLEIGTGRGGTLFFFARAAADDALIVSVDLPDGPFGGGYPKEYARMLRSFSREHQRIHLVRGDSHHRSTIRTVRKLVGDRPVDVILIDGDHSYEGVRSDFESYAPLVRSGGLIAFHDIVPGPESAVGSVPQFWHEIKSDHRDSAEIVENWKQGGFGIGLIRV